MEPVPEKKKRGRPSVYRKFFGNEQYKTAMKLELKGKCDRSVTNELYIRQGLLLARVGLRQLLLHDVHAQAHTVVADVGAPPGHQPLHLILTAAAEGTADPFFIRICHLNHLL